MVKLIEGQQKYYFPSTFPWPPLNHVYNNQWVKFMKKLWWCKSLFDILLGCEVNTNWVRLRKLRLPNEKPAEDLRGGWYLTSSKLFTKGMCLGDVAVHAHKTVASAVSSPGAGKVLWPLSCPSSSILFCLSSRTTHPWLWPCQLCPSGVWPALVWTHRLWSQRTLIVLSRFIFFPP